jgi:hypothetical protein
MNSAHKVGDQSLPSVTRCGTKIWQVRFPKA